MRQIAFLALVMTLVSACGTATDRYTVSAPKAAQKQRIAFGSVEVRDVSLPAYATDDEIVLRALDGRLIGSGVLWADTPERAISLELSRHIAQISGARAAASPWPFEALPDARLGLRFETFLAGEDGQFLASGQYFVAVADGRRERSGLFELSVAFDVDAGPSAIAAARGQIILDLAEFLARTALR